MPHPRRLKYLLLRMALLLFTVSAMVCLTASLLFLLAPTASLSLSLPARLQQALPAYLQTDHRGWYAASSMLVGDETLKRSNEKTSQKEKKWDQLYHLGGNGPWIPMVDGVVEGGIAVPEGCEVDMIHMLSRHGERYPTASSGARMVDLVTRIKDSPGVPSGPLAFLNTWEFFSETAADFEQLTHTGPYAGVLEAFTTGVKLATRYAHLKANISAAAPTYLWASDSTRVIDTARHFAAGFFGLESPAAKVVVISEDADRGGDTLTPGDTCTNYVTDATHGHDYGAAQLALFQSTYLPALSARLSPHAGVTLTPDEVYSMQEMCGFELLVRGTSPWCSVFTHADWRNFEYARDLLHYYRAGPGNPYARAMGWLWLNATTHLLTEGPAAAGPVYASFVHDGDVVPMLAALGLFDEPGSAEGLPATHVRTPRRWATSQIVPMGGRIILERLTCRSDGDEAERFVRFNVNDGIVALDGCSDGPGGSCGLGRFGEYVEKRGEQAGRFALVCGLSSEAPTTLGFLRQPGYGGREQSAGKKKRAGWWG
ncbi:histidine phosphatase superfamily, partial [Geopyxis carbonaria]